MKAYYHSTVLSQRLAAFYDSADPEYLVIEVDGFKEKLKLRAQPGNKFEAAIDGDEFRLWERSGYAEYSPFEVLKHIKDKISVITFLDKTFRSWREFARFLEDSQVEEYEKYRSTVEFPESVGIAIRLKAVVENKHIKDIVVDAVKAYL